MLPKTRRLTKHEVPKVLRRGIRVSGSLMRLIFASLSAAGGSRFAVVVSKKVALRAVDRNLIRRRTYEALKRTPKPTTGVLAVFSFLPSKTKTVPPYKVIEREVRMLVSRAR